MVAHRTTPVGRRSAAAMQLHITLLDALPNAKSHAKSCQIMPREKIPQSFAFDGDNVLCGSVPYCCPVSRVQFPMSNVQPVEARS
jgi:hypothetical protein